MPFDGLFLNKLTSELSEILNGSRVNKIYQPNALDIVLTLRNHGKTYNLLLSSNLELPTIHITNIDFANPLVPNNFCMVLRKYITSSKLLSIEQIDNDRLIKLTFQTYNELGDSSIIMLFFEIMGKNSNIILTNNSLLIIDCLRKLLPVNENSRIIIPKAQYVFPEKNKFINPFKRDSNDITLFEGCSKDALNEMKNDSIDNVINHEILPVQSIEKPNWFYYYPLKTTCFSYNTYTTLSTLLDKIFKDKMNNTSNNSHELQKTVKSIINRLNTKISNLHDDIDIANSQAIFNEYGLLLQANLWMINDGSNSIQLQNYLDNSFDLVTIPLDTNLTKTQNMNNYFSLYKKSRNTIFHANQQIEIANQEISYLEEQYFQLDFVNTFELNQIKDELIEHKYLKQRNKKQMTRKKQEILTYLVDGVKIYVGKNNIQNNYLTNQFAKPSYYFFHIKDGPGSHVIVETNELTENIIRTAANIAAYYSKFSKSSSVAVDYTTVKNVSKIKGMIGSMVKIVNQKTIYIDPDEDYIKQFQK